MKTKEEINYVIRALKERIEIAEEKNWQGYLIKAKVKLSTLKWMLE